MPCIAPEILIIWKNVRQIGFFFIKCGSLIQGNRIILNVRGILLSGSQYVPKKSRVINFFNAFWVSFPRRPAGIFCKPLQKRTPAYNGLNPLSAADYLLLNNHVRPCVLE